MEVWKGELDGEAGEAGTGTQIKEGLGGRKMTGGEEGLAEVAADDLFRTADGGEVGAGVPFQEEVEIEGELVQEERSWVGIVRGQEGGDGGLGEGGHSFWAGVKAKATADCPVDS